MTSENYFSWRGEVGAFFHSVTETAQLLHIVQQQIERLGFDYFALLIQHPVPFTRPETHLFTTFPARWLRHYRREKFIEIDPVVRMRHCPGRIVQWCDELFAGCERLWRDAKDFGLRAGFSCSIMATNRAIGILSVSSRISLKTIGLCPLFEMKLQHLTELYLQTLLRLEDRSMLVLDMLFSERELEIVKWTAEGKTAAEISLILGISEHTVNFHQKNMQKKFNVANKTQLACYAAATGLL
ncbi:transcriptional regulator SdiA [Erwinia sp. V71]|uniref:transcriptional regulator SdiA n=1 Tax=Erwinia sp. V71 TaxID=3369424 RepID=UPI003F62D889